MGENTVSSDYITIVAEEDGVTIIGLTRGKDTRFHHTEKLDKGEAYVAQFTEITSAIKIRGKAKLYTKMGIVQTGE
ncbi:MAG: trp RNA-binding attenuation protein MtrB [Clostridia bacterium]|nr:trp RNA-binding attenuation protein MtrB [Clostridia bacterium]